MFSINRSCGCSGSQSCKLCRRSDDHPKVYINKNEQREKSRYLFKHDDEDQCEHHDKNDHKIDDCDKQKCKWDDDCEKDNCKCGHKKHKCNCHHPDKDNCKWDDCEIKICRGEYYQEHDSICEDCEVLIGECDFCEIMQCDCDERHGDICKIEHKCCKEEVKGLDLCRKKEELRCFKHCGPVSQPCDSIFYNHFTSRANLSFSGLIVVKNTGNLTNGCSMEVRVTDRAGTSTVAIVSPGASVPIFVECLSSLDIACFQNVSEPPVPATCSGEVIFDLEYCTTRYV